MANKTLNFLTKKIRERSDEKKRNEINRATMDRELETEKDTMYQQSYKAKRKQQMQKEVNQQVDHDIGNGNNRLAGLFSTATKPIKSGRIRQAGNAAQSGINFLSGGDLFGGMGGGGASTSRNIEDMLGFGGNTRSQQPKTKGKRTTIRTGGKTITISENAAEGDSGNGKKKTKNYWDNLDDVMNQELPF